MFDFVKKWSVMLKWWAFFSIFNVGIVFIYLTGLVDLIYEVDFTKLSFIIFGMCYVITVRHGITIYKFCKIKAVNASDITQVCNKNEVGWFMADAFLTVGMIGTVIGFIYTLSTSFMDIDPSNVVAPKVALSKISIGMGTALFTTAVGLISRIILIFQLFDFQQYIDKLGELCGCSSTKE